MKLTTLSDLINAIRTAQSDWTTLDWGTDGTETYTESEVEDDAAAALSYGDDAIAAIERGDLRAAVELLGLAARRSKIKHGVTPPVRRPVRQMVQEAIEEDEDEEREIADRAAALPTYRVGRFDMPGRLSGADRRC